MMSYPHPFRVDLALYRCLDLLTHFIWYAIVRWDLVCLRNQLSVCDAGDAVAVVLNRHLGAVDQIISPLCVGHQRCVQLLLHSEVEYRFVEWDEIEVN